MLKAARGVKRYARYVVLMAALSFHSVTLLLKAVACSIASA